MKLDISVSKTITINTGNYSSVKPSVTVTAKEVDVLKFKEVSEKISNITDILLHFEAVSLCDTINTIQEVGIDHLINSHEQIKDDMNNELENDLKFLIESESTTFSAADMEKMLGKFGKK